MKTTEMEMNSVEKFFFLTKNLRFSKIKFSASQGGGHYPTDEERTEFIADPEDELKRNDEKLKCNIVHSLIEGQPESKFSHPLHKVVLDIDHEAILLPSSTPGHHHLIIDVPVFWPQYVCMMRAMAEAGVLEEGYARASEARGHSDIRTPWTSKKDEDDVPEMEGF